MAATPTIIVSYAGREEKLEIGVKPSVELGDDEVEKAAEELWNKLRQVFQLTVDSRLTLHETETGRILSKETFRDPSHIPFFPKYWYLTVENSLSTTSLANLNFQSLSGEDLYPTMDCSDLTELLLMEGYSPLRPDHNQDTRSDQYDEDDDLSKYDVYPSLTELSMGQSPSLDGSREDLMTISLTCDKEGLFGITLRHFTVIANVPHSEHSSSESGSRNGSRSGSRCSTHSSSDSYDVLRMSTLFVHSVSPGGPAEVGGLQNGDIVYSINGNSISGSTTEEIIGYIEESGSNVVFWVSPERHDDLLFLYPQYVQGEAGEYSRDGSEKIIVTDIIVKTSLLVSPKENVSSTERRRLYRPVSADERLLHRITSGLDSYLIEDNYPPVLNTTSSPREDSSTNSLSSEVEGYNSSNDDLLISGALEDIPIEPSPLQHRRHYVRNNNPSLSNHFDQPSRAVSQDWLSQDVRLSNGTGPEWFPGAVDDPREFTFSLSMNATSKHDPSSPMSQSGEHSYSGQPNSNSGPNKLARKFKQTIKTLKESATGHRKLVKTSSLGMPQTRSTSALDRMKIKNSSPSSLSPQTQQRSRSTDLGRIKLKRESLEALTKVSSAENLAMSSSSSSYLQKQHSDEKTHNIPNNRVPTIAVTRMSVGHQPVVHQSVKSEETASPPQYEQCEELSQSLGSTQQLSQEHGRNLSCESNGSGQTSLKSRAVGKSYRSQRERLHQTRSNPRSSSSDDKEGFTTSLIVAPSSSPNFSNIPRRIPRDSPSNESLSFTRIGSSRHTYRQNRPAKNSYNTKPDGLTSPTDPNVHLLSSQEHYYSTGNNSTFDNSYSKTHVQLTSELRQSGKPLVRSHSMNEGSDNSDISSKHQSLTASIDSSHLQQHQELQYRHRSSGHIDRQSFTKSLLVQPSPPVYNSSMYNSRDEIKRDRRKEELKDKRKDELAKNQLGKFNSIFHGPINKKHERSQGGRKSSERSWRAIYAAIQGHHMVFYNTVQDALTGHPLSSDPALDLHHCMVTVLPRKKHMFRLSFSDASECLIQAENEESMMRWMRIIHNLNRMRRMGPLPPHLQNRGSTQDDTIKKEQSPLKRIYTPQPPNKRSRDKDDTSRKVLLDKLKRTIRNRSGTKDTIDGNVEVPYYNTFGLPLEECPASYESKNVPLVMMICVKEIETQWLDTEGLYRVAGPIGQVKTLASELNRGRYDLLQGHNDPHVITAILKKFLKELPNPLIPADKYDLFISSARDPDPESRTIKLKELVRELPQIHHHTLAFLMRHLNKVETHSNINKMAQRNLCLVFGPTVVRKPNDEENSSLVTDMNFTYTIIETLMNNVDNFFDPFHTLIVNYTDEDDLSPPQRFMPDSPLKRGDSDPSSSYKRSLSHTSRRSFDETHAKSLLSINSQATGGEVPFSFSLGNEYSFSQEFREGKRHKRHRLARSRKLLTSHEEEPQKDLSSPVNPNPPSTSPPLTSPMSPFGIHARPKVHNPPSRKLSYNTAIQDGQITLSGGNAVDSDLLEEPFSHQGLSRYNGRHYQMSHHQPSHVHMRSYHQQSGLTNFQDGQKRRWSSTGPFTEIVGPSASNNWTNNSWTDTRLKATPVSSSLRGPESRL